MNIDPHTIQQILIRIREQLRCPQCRKHVDISIEGLKVLNDNFAVMQAQCPTCDAHIMLHATIAVVAKQDGEKGVGKNASTNLMVDVDEITELKKSLQSSNGSFSKIFGNP
ncbi:MAG TPA: hypothetical protein VJB82_03700 [Candidatus Peribacterales bacterium]|nr:hypothetical protein [Candidatus Peribacterales bacterium]